MSEKFLKVEDLVVEYRTGGKVVHAVNNVSFELERGKTLGLVGETGAGKTTIAKTILFFRTLRRRSRVERSFWMVWIFYLSARQQ